MFTNSNRSEPELLHHLVTLYLSIAFVVSLFDVRGGAWHLQVDAVRPASILSTTAPSNDGGSSIELRITAVRYSLAPLPCKPQREFCDAPTPFAVHVEGRSLPMENRIGELRRYFGGHAMANYGRVSVRASMARCKT